MPALNVTAARLGLLKAVAAGEVKHHTRSVPSESFDEWRPGGYGGKKVTKQVEWLQDAGLVRQGPKEHASFYALAPWELTDAGREWLAANEEKA